MMANIIAGDRDGKGAPRLAIVYQPIDLLKPNPGNARTHSKRQIRLIADSMQACGNNSPILVDGELTVISGHARLLASRQLAFSEVPTISLEHLSPTQVRLS